MFDSRLALGVSPYGCLRGNGDESGCFDLDEVFQAAKDILEKIRSLPDAKNKT
jgi:hypothetical protein